ncbi:heat-inducible transcriptional repressor HrcA [Vagococcus carniphilus]|uniref:Heat-inducible transcription repressor HrcA n=1 Tax=Vagococcus carniphilus TaxID=218144 RepID=A0A430B7Y8_9ENTE|nr:heat-inducible transcriptional repressor HrcA [Vagococcus carniphilus]MDT2815456.1 heat-inducible transcriptional repressor HrcA [Vagococcus carniphilus]MDT2829497.1 heat-inducible transcriptional repressor HrcA [Vagococcus carniphilus]MDT2833161.1 heat-inducible transcriptional repressor HrcA [Vagococcus carniphilus]MDT2847753.1 heat-inducible transcriptional repressor HrcA [Vagococcus carniphilus]MDT2853014.1 heat-inducible transcriptional repressor HrcA [Vagococcus carniphilus]
MLSERQLNILHMLVKIYTETGVPVSSKTLMNHGINASSATIRNDLAKLEEFELIQKMHSSSGRVPSIKGYRFYVDHLMTPVEMTNHEVIKIRQMLNQRYNATNEIIEQSAKILSDLTSYTAFSLGPEVKERKLTGFRIVPLNRNQLIAIIVTDQGYVESQVFSIPNDISSEDIEKMIRIINDRLVGENLLTVYHKLRTEIPLVLQKYFSNSSNVLYLFEEVFNQAFDDQIYISGGMNLLNSEVLTDVAEFKSIYSLISDSDKLTEILLPDTTGIDIKIGDEIENELLLNMSLITASYEVPEHGKGVIALLGPTSMSYSKLLGLVNVFKDELSGHLDSYYRSLESPLEK